MTDFQSKVTRRPRSRLERLVSALEAATPRAKLIASDPLDALSDVQAKLEAVRLLDSKPALPAEVLRARLESLGIRDRALIDQVLLRAGKGDTVAPTENALRVVVRLGYPGDTYESVARALDAELPGSDTRGIATRAHDLLDVHGRAICLPVGPACKQCCVAERCEYRGEGADPSARLRLKVIKGP